MTRKSFSGAAVPTTLTANMSSSDTTFIVASISNWPNTTTGPFVVTVDRGLSTEEKILCASYAGQTVSVASGGRGYDGTTAQAHTAPASVNCTLDAVTIDSHDAFVNGNGSVTPTTSVIGDVASNGTSTFPAAADHKHAREQFATGATTSSAPGDNASDGSSNSPARADHKHGRETVTYGTPGNSAVTDTAAQGSSNNFARADHVHGREGFGTPGSSTPGDSAAQGSATTVARSDHTHGREAKPTGLVLVANHVASPSYAMSGGTYAVINTSTATVTFTAPASGNVIITESGVWNPGATGVHPLVCWSSSTTNNTSLVGNPVNVGTVDGKSYKVVEHYISGLTPGASTTLYLQGCTVDTTGTITLGNSYDVIFKVISL